MDATVTLRRVGNSSVIPGLAILLLVAMLFSLTIGAVSIPVSEVGIILLKNLGLFKGVAIDSTHELVITTIRFPRIVMTMLIGAMLGVSERPFRVYSEIHWL